MGTAYAEWIQFMVRWVHLIAGISWIGNSFYFMWLDSAISAPAQPNPHLEGDLWRSMGGLLLSRKTQDASGRNAPVLHWFKWEATLTWLSGILLLGIIYYLSSSIYLIPSGSTLTPLTAIAASLGLLTVSWFVYDFFWQSFVCSKFIKSATTASLILVMILAWGLCQLFTGRAAFIHLGAIFEPSWSSTFGSESCLLKDG